MNNREIKFRAWDKTYNRMNYKVQVGNTDHSDPNYTCNSIWVDYGDRKTIGWMNADEACIELMQFTGLKDKNGKEIYEGDIVRFKSWRDVLQRYKDKTREVKCQEGFFYPLVSFGDEPPGKEYEVIGNIYEHPHLITNPERKER